MSTLSGIASKGEKGNSRKYQSLDINSLYRGESLEPNQQKNALPRKTGMQNLGKLPSARRPPANLPSLKSEHSGNDPAISLVPSGGSGWGTSKPGETVPAPGTPVAPTTPNATVTPTSTSQIPQGAATLSPATPAAVPVAAVNVTPVASPQGQAHGHAHGPHPQQHPHPHSHPLLGGGGSSGDKSWSSIMVGGGAGNDPTNVAAPSFLAHQSPLFQQEFPSLSSGDGQGPAAGQKGGSGAGVTTPSGPEAQYGPGPSLRPQSGDLGGGRSNLGPLGPQGAGMGPAGQANGPSSSSHPGGGPLAGQAGPIGAFRGVMPSFMYRGNFPGPFPPNFQGPVHGPGTRPRYPYPQDSRFPLPSRLQPPNERGRDRGRDRDNERDGDRERDDDIMPRPIIKEEDLNRMDDIGRDAGWAIHDDIDYNQKLTFSDDESTPNDDKKKSDLKDIRDLRDPRGGREDRDRDRPVDRDRDRDRDRDPDKMDRDELAREDRRSTDKRWQSGRGPPLGDFRSSSQLTAPVGGPGSRGVPHGSRVVEEEQLWYEQRRKQSEHMASIVERAKQRKEEEERRFEERQAKAKQKLAELDAKRKGKDGGNVEDLTSSAGNAPTEARDGDEKPLQRDAAEFRQLTQIERPSFLRERERERERDRGDRDRERDRDRDRDRDRERDRGDRDRERDRDRDMRAERMSGHGETGPQFSRQFQSNLPPRFQKQQAERHGSSFPTSQPASSNQSFDQRWALPTTNNAVVYQPSKGGHGSGGRRNRSDGEAPGDRDREPLDDRPPSRDPRDPRDARDRRDRHTPDANDRYRPARDRDYRTYPEGAGRKGFYEGSDYGRHGRGDDYHGPDYDRKERDDARDPRHSDSWDRFEERRGGAKKDYKPHAAVPEDFEDRERDRDMSRQDSGEWRDKDRRDHRESRERDLREPRDLRDPRDREAREGRLPRDFRDRDRDARDLRDPRDLRERELRDIRNDRERDVIREVRERDTRDVRDRDRDIRRDRDDREIPRERDVRDVRDVRDRERERDSRERDPRERDPEPQPRPPRRGPRDVDGRDIRDARDFRDERPQRPDSRDSRASRESRNSRDSTRDEQKLDGPASWADATFDPHYESKDKKHRDFHRGDRRDASHVPGPITQDKLAALDSKLDEKSTFVRLQRSLPPVPITSSTSTIIVPPSQTQCDKSERKSSAEAVEAWRSPPSKVSDLPAGEKDLSGGKAWADQLPIDHSRSPEPDTKKGDDILATDKPKPAMGAMLIEELTNMMEDKLEVGDTHHEPRSDDDKVREEEKVEEGKPKGGGRRSGRGGRSADQPRGGVRQGGPAGTGSGSGSHRSSRSYSGRNRSRRGQGGDWVPGSESEVSADEVSASTESGKDDTRLAEGGKRDRRGPRSPKPSGRKDDKDREKDKDKEGGSGGRRQGHDGSGAPRGAHKENISRDGQRDALREVPKEGLKDMSRDPGREGFAPRGEPSRRGRGSLHTRGALGRRMDGYGPPSSKSPFGQATSLDKSESNDGMMDSQASNALSEPDDKRMQPSVNAGVIGSGLRTGGGPPGMNTGTGKPGSGPPGSQGPPRMNRKSDGERKDRRKDGRQSSRANKQNSVDGAEDWDSVSEGSEADQDLRNGPMGGGGGNRDGAGGGGRRGFRQQPGGGSGSQSQSGKEGSGGRSGSGRRGGSSSNSGQGGRGEKRRDGNSGSSNSQPSGNGFDRRAGGNSAPQTNGRSGGNRSAQSGGKMSQGTVSVNRIDEVKLNDPSLVSQTLSDLNKKEKEKTNSLEGIDLNNYASVVVVDDHPEVAVQEDPSLFDADNGFQEVRNKKTSKDMKKEEAVNKGGRGKPQSQQAQPPQQPSGQLTSSQLPSGQSQSASGQGSAGGQQQSIMPGQQPPPLMGLNTQPTGKQGFERSRPCKLPPRLAKQRENNRLQKQQAAAAQQHDVNEMNKMNQNISMYPMKDPSGPAPPPPVNAWEKPINASLRPNSPATNLSSGLQLGATITDNCSIEPNEHGPGSGGSSQRSSPAVDKLSREVREAREARDARDSRDQAAKDGVLDGASPPVQTIIFENTNFKQGPSASSKFPNHHKVGRIEKGREAEDASTHPSHVPHSHQHPHAHLGLETISFPPTKSTEDGDMKLDFSFECTELQMDEKAKGMSLPRSMHSNISPSTADLNFKIASVKKVWETMPTVMEQGHGDDTQAYAPTFNSEAGLDPAAFGKAVESPQMQMDEPSEVVYSPGPQMQPNPNSYVTSVVSGVSSVAGVSAVPGMMKADPNSASPNVCKVKPQPSAVMPPGPGAGQLSPPPFNSQPASHIANFQPTMSSTAAQFGGISAIPSPPTVLFNSSQGGLYQTFLEPPQVLGGQPLGGQPLGGQPLGGQPLGGQPLGGQPLGGQPLGGQPRSQFTGFTPYQLSQGLNQTSAFNQQSVYVHQSAPPPHPPPSAGPDLYQSMSQYRMQPTAGPFGQSQQLSSNPSTVLISSSSNSLMSASVKPTSHSGQIGAIGTKGAAPGPYQASAPQPSQLFIPYDPNVLSVNQNFLSSSQLVQRAAPVQNMQPSSSFYSTSAGAQAGFYQAGSSLQAAPAPQQLHQTPTPYGLQSFSSHSPFLSSNLQMAAAVQQQQQYRNSQPSYLKGGLGQQAQPPPPSSPSSQQPEMLTSVFSTGPQIPSPKSRDSKRSQGQQSQSGPQGGQGGQNQHSPTPQHQGDQRDQRSGSGPAGQQSGPQGHKFSSYQGMPQSSHMLQQNVRGSQMNMGSRGMGQSGQSRYPTPIQRPVPYGQGGMQSGNMNMNRHRTPAHNTSRPPPSMGKQGYYGSAQGGSVKMDGSGSADTKPETNNTEHKDATPAASSSADGSASTEASKDEAPASTAE